MKKLLSLLCVAALAVSVLAGCGGVKTDNEPAANAGGGEGGAAVMTAKKDAYADDIKVAFLPNVIGDSCAKAWADGMKSYFDSFSNVTFDVYDGEASVDTQVTIMDQLINNGYDAIILQATEATGLAGSVDKAEAAGIPVITCNLDAQTVHAGLVAGVDVEAGQLIANSMIDSGAEKVLIISATAGATKGENIDKGFKEVAEGKLEILDEQSGEWLTENAQTVMADFLTKYPEIDAVLCHNDAMAEGAAEACKAAGRTGIEIWGVDGESKMLDYIERGDCYGTIYTNANAQGQLCAQTIMFALQSGMTAANLSATPLIKMSPIVVTPDTVSQITPDMRW